MPASPSIDAGGGSCVLSFMLHPGYSGYAALDGWGLRVFRTSHLSSAPSGRLKALVNLLMRLLRRHRPTRVVLGLPPREAAEIQRLHDEAKRTIGNLGFEVVIRPLRDALTAIGFRAAHGSPNGLAHHLASKFFPELKAEVKTSLNRFWYRRPAWHALALAIYELLRLSPMHAAAVVPAAAYRVPAFRSAVQSALAPAV